MKKKVAKAAWPLVCKPKGEGGLGVLNLQTHNQALRLKHLHKFFNNSFLPWVKLIWDKHYRNGRLPSSSNLKGSFWWKDALKFPCKFKGRASVKISNGHTCLLWDDIWNGNIRKLQFPELYSFAKDKSISLSKAHSSDPLCELFSLPLSVEAFGQFQNLQLKFSEVTLNEMNDVWTYI